MGWFGAYPWCRGMAVRCLGLDQGFRVCLREAGSCGGGRRWNLGGRFPDSETEEGE